MFYLVAALFVWGVILYWINQSLDSGVLGRILDVLVDLLPPYGPRPPYVPPRVK